MDFLLPKEQLKGLSEEDQKAVKDDALKQFLLGSIFGGGGIATGYQAVQNIIPTMQKQRQQQGLLQELGSIQNEFFPSPTQAGQRAFVNQPTRTSTDFGPSPEAALRQQQILSAGPNYADLQTRLAKLALNPAAAPLIPSLQASFGAFKPNITDGVVTNIRNQPTAVIPRADLKSGLQLGGTVQDGNINFNATDIAGFADASARNQLPPLTAGTRFVFDSFGRRIGTTNDPGAVPALAERTAAEVIARETNTPRAGFTPSGAPTFVYANPPSVTGGVGQPTGTAQRTVAQPETGPSTAQAILNEAYKPILADAYKGFQTAKKTAPVIDQLQNAYNQPGFDTGSFTNVRTQLGNVFNSLGVSGERNKQFLTNAISARQGINALTGESLSEAVGAISNFEIGYYGQRNAQITDPKESTNFNLAVLREANKRKQDFYNFVSDKNNAGPDVLAKWASSPQGQKQMFEAPSLRKYLPTKKVVGGPDDGKIAYILPNGDATTFD
jgi:hypothetical protein